MVLLTAVVVLFSCSREAPAILTPKPPESPQTIFLNEIFAGGTAIDPDWVEIFNASGTAQDISGYKIYDGGGQSGSKPKKELPAGSVVPPAGFLVIVTDDTTASGFGISKNGDEIWLEDATGKVIDHVVVPPLTDIQSYGRKFDGGATWAVDTVTRGSSNSGGAVALLDLMLNEAYSRGTVESPDWVEIYNPNTVAVSLSGYKIYDPGAVPPGTKQKKEFPTGAVVPPRGYYVIVVDEDPNGFGLSSSGDEIWLENPAGTVIDYVKIPALQIGQTYARIPDGSPNWQLTNTMTRGAPNQP